MPWAAAAVVAAVPRRAARPGRRGPGDRGTSRYVLDPKATTVDATITIDLRNVTPNRGGFYYFFDAFSVPVPAGAEKVRARSGGSSLSVSLRGHRRPVDQAGPDLVPEPALRALAHDHADLRGAGEKPAPRTAPGSARVRDLRRVRRRDAGRNTVEVVAPSSMTFDATSDDFTESEQGRTTHPRWRPPRGRLLGRGLAARPRPHRRAGRRRRGVSLLLNGFEDDPKWADFVARQVTKGDPRPGEARRHAVARWPRAHPRGRLAVAARLRRLVRPDRRRDRHRRAARRRPDLPRAVARLGVRRAVRRALGVRGTGPGARRARRRGHRWHAHEHPKVSRGSSGRRRAQRLGRLGGQPLARTSTPTPTPRPTRRPARCVADLDDDELAAVRGCRPARERAYDPAGTKDADGGRTSWLRWLDLLETRGGVKRRPRGLPAAGRSPASSGPSSPPGEGPRRLRRRSTRPTVPGSPRRACATR